ncbi:MAG TPA: inositol monophosphatase family protein [Candidatus Saccharimonadales bacterium]|nr:inositol monophosphatase family protein [Candidatus Saccharimonadales bacterium]
MQQRETLRELAVAAAASAAALVVRAHAGAGPRTAEVKSPGDYVTDVDRAAEQAAITVLRAGAPDIAILAEEAGGDSADRMWVVDPIDGTTNFLRGFPVVGVSVALVEAGQPVVGAVNAPLLGASWSAAAGQGATDDRGRRLSVSAHPGAGIVATGFPFRRKERLPRYFRVFERALTTFEDLRRAGAASLDLAYVAAGVFDGFFELGLGIWDIAAGALLVREAGGVVTDWAGNADAVFVSGDILAGTPAWHEAMLEIVAA